jgi:hypothetical protein
LREPANGNAAVVAQLDDRYVLGGAQGAADVEAVHLGQHQVEDDQVLGAPQGLVDGRPTVAHDGGGVPVAVEDASDDVRVFVVVFGDEDARPHLAGLADVLRSFL